MAKRLVAVLFATIILATSSVAVAAAPAAGEAKKKPNPILAYFGNRLKDFSDIFSVKLALADGSSLLGHVRVTRLAQIGAGRFSGTKIGFDGPSAGIYGEGRVEYGVSVFYWAWIGRKWSEAGVTEEAAKRNQFFGKVDDIKADEQFREYYDGHEPWYTIGASAALPFLPGFEVKANPAEAVDFVLSIFGIPGLRVPPPFYKVDVGGERVPAVGCIRWHGQEEFEQYD